MPIIDFNAAVATNPYTQEVADLIAAGEGKASYIDVPTATKNAARRKFAHAANAADKTARLRLDEVIKDENGQDTDQTRLTFTLKAKDAPRRGKDADTAEAPAEAQVEAEVEAPAEAEVEAEVKPRNRR